MNLDELVSYIIPSGLFQLALGNSGATLVLGITALIMQIIIIILAISLHHSMRAADENNAMINRYIAALPPEKLSVVMSIYESTRKEQGIGLILCLVGGTFLAQRIYLGKSKAAVLSVIFFWTGIPAIISVFDLVNMPCMISQYNLGIIQSLYNQLAAEKIED